MPTGEHHADRLALRPKEAAAALGVDERTLRKWRREEGLPYFQVDRSVLIPVVELKRWMAERATTCQTKDQTVDQILREL